MVRNGGITPSDVKRIFKRYWWVIPTSMLLTALLGFIATLVLPKKYTSQTMVLVEPPAVSQDVVPTVLNEDLYRHLSSMQEQILSRSSLQSIINKFNLYPDQRVGAQLEDAIDRLKKAIDVELIQPMPGSANRQPPGFDISVTFSDPQLAQQICTEITSMFIERNTATRMTDLKNTTDFLTQQLNDAKTNLDEQDAKLAQFKRQYLGSLPEEQQSNLSLLTSMNSQLEATTQALSRAQQDKTFNESLLASQDATWKAQSSGAPTTDTLQTQLDTLQDHLTELLAKYTPQYPDVIKTKTQIEEIKRRMAAAPDTKNPPAQAPTAHEPVQMQTLRAKIKQDELSIADLSKHQAQIQDQIRGLQGHVQASPMVEQQLKELTRNYQTALDNYNDLLKKQQKSTIAGDLEHQQQGENYRILDAPSLPAKPSFPKKSIFVGGGFGAGLVLALGIMYLLAMSDKAMYSERDVEHCLKLPVLTMVPGFDVAMVEKSGHGLR
ncbi:MAG TPA: Wzz/FepE/Etk N-terminal domain-containing protein [Verrucomicrobiae bacterium]|jgi:polysaccharide chain length determinant protein (PEP-CTERM system associated)|nr:Wzz/FepE/Etk N-terminal domain-containing protein [Verrucomicrobiae bacterium]